MATVLDEAPGDVVAEPLPVFLFGVARRQPVPGLVEELAGQRGTDCAALRRASPWFGSPCLQLRLDRAPELRSNDRWMLGSPWENGYVESFNGKLRDELLNGEIFYILKETKVVIERWRQEFNRLRPHSSLGYRPPAPETIWLKPAPLPSCPKTQTNWCFRNQVLGAAA